MQSRARMWGAVAALSMSSLALGTSTAAADPAPCNENYDYGVVGEVSASWITGRWFNCAGGGTDRVFLEVNNAPDSGCISVAFGNAGGVGYDPFFFPILVDHTATWRRC